MPTTALIVGAGSGLSASLARLFAAEGMTVALAARRTEKLSQLCFGSVFTSSVRNLEKLPISRWILHHFSNFAEI